MKRDLVMVLGGGLVVGFFLLAASAMAGGDVGDVERIAGNGDPFRLGQLNGASRITKLINNAPLNNDSFKINNNTNGNQARAIGVRSEGPRSTIESVNGGDGPALSLLVNPGEAPFTVNRSVRVTNLNADLVDGQHGPFLRDDFYTRTNPSAGNNTPNASTTITAACDDGDQIISGGYFNVDESGTVVTASFPNSEDEWEVTIRNDGTADTITVVAYCANTA